ncbi:hypothetical protein BCR44DRAFT_1431987 [Catenaria anguillulae PL171]|uniref:Uncharacterized protein n=1 Tax=Catenaria anguillulae PL171 TaxID=765915 RepID=A0A1Y2HQR0_9FUNG|nr:hypothetical protein BCR44DRAFT_1431987 [Catenaria anguillulae PL171]
MAAAGVTGVVVISHLDVDRIEKSEPAAWTSAEASGIVGMDELSGVVDEAASYVDVVVVVVSATGAAIANVIWHALSKSQTAM